MNCCQPAGSLVLNPAQYQAMIYVAQMLSKHRWWKQGAMAPLKFKTSLQECNFSNRKSLQFSKVATLLSVVSSTSVLNCRGNYCVASFTYGTTFKGMGCEVSPLCPGVSLCYQPLNNSLVTQPSFRWSMSLHSYQQNGCHVSILKLSFLNS